MTCHNIHIFIHTHKHTQTQRETDRQTGRQTDRQTDRQAGRQTDRQTDRETDRERQRKTEKRQRESYTHTDFNVAIFGKIGKLKTRAIVTNLTHAKSKFFSETSNLRKLLGKLREIN